MPSPLDRATCLPRCSRAIRCSARATAATAVMAVVAAIAGSTGCASRGATDEAHGAEPVAGGAATATESRDELVARTYLVGPEAARQLGTRIDWQVPATPFGPTRLVTIGDDSLFVVDSRNLVARIAIHDGRVIWRVPAVNEVDRIAGVYAVPARDRVLVVTDSEIVLLDLTTGGIVGKQQLAYVGSVEPVLVGDFLVYGARNGQLVWHSHGVGAYWKAYQVASTISARPAIADGYVVACGGDGRLISIGLSSVTQVWNDRALAPVRAQPTIARGVAFFAGTDQYLRAYELGFARPALWARLTTAPLTTSPVVIGERLYQAVPGAGLQAFEAFPANQPGGVHVWTAPDVTGAVVMHRGSDLYAWDPDRRRMQLVDASMGAAGDAIELPRIHRLIVPDQSVTAFFAVSEDGEVLRLVERR